MTFNTFIDQYLLSDENGIGYLAQTQLFEQIERLRCDFLIPDYCALSGTFGIEEFEKVYYFSYSFNFIIIIILFVFYKKNTIQ